MFKVTGVMSGLLEFVEARIAEDEATATRYSLREWRAVDGYTVQGDHGVAGQERHGASEWGICRTAGRPDAEFIARHDPARVLRECEAKRRMIDFIFAEAETIDGEWGDGHRAAEIRAGLCSDHGGKTAIEGLTILASVYADHPDYRPELTA